MFLPKMLYETPRTKRGSCWGTDMSATKRWLWFLPFSALIAGVVIYQILRTFTLSFFRFSLATNFHTTYTVIDNFRRLAADSRFLTSLVTTTRFTIISVTIEF